MNTEEGKQALNYAIVTLFWAVVAFVLTWKGWPDCALAASICAIIFGIVAVYFLGEYQGLRRDLREWERRQREPFNRKRRNEEIANL